MSPDLLARVVVGAQAGSLVLTNSEATDLVQIIGPHTAVVIDGQYVEICRIPWHILPDDPGRLLELPSVALDELRRLYRDAPDA